MVKNQDSVLELVAAPGRSKQKAITWGPIIQPVSAAMNSLLTWLEILKQKQQNNKKQDLQSLPLSRKVGDSSL